MTRRYSYAGGVVGATGPAGAAGATGATGPAGSGTVINSVNNFRLTLTTAVPVTTTDVTGATTLFWTPVDGNHVSTYDSSVWTDHTSAEVSLALGTLTSGKNYDVFAYYTGSVMALELSAAWTNDTTRADAIALQDGIQVKSGTASRRLVGTFRTTSTTATEDSMAKRFLWNRYNKVSRLCRNPAETADTWTYNTTTVRQANANAANQFEWVTGDAAMFLDATAIAQASISSGNGAFGPYIGIDSTTTPTVNSTSSTQIIGGNTAFIVGITAAFQCSSRYLGSPGLGYHYAAWLERGIGATTTFYGDAGAPTFWQSGICGSILA